VILQSIHSDENEEYKDESFTKKSILFNI
jgi:hypothetical protein